MPLWSHHIRRQLAALVAALLHPEEASASEGAMGTEGENVTSALFCFLPQDYIFYLEPDKLESGKGKCSYDPKVDTVSALISESCGSPGPVDGQREHSPRGPKKLGSGSCHPCRGWWHWAPSWLQSCRLEVPCRPVTSSSAPQDAFLGGLVTPGRGWMEPGGSGWSGVAGGRLTSAPLPICR